LTVQGQPEIFEDSLSVQFPFQFPMLQSSLIRRRPLLETGCFEDGLRSDEDFLAGFQIACRYKFAAISSVVTRFYRTSDLVGTSLQYNFGSGPDYYRSRMIAYALAVERTGRKEPWAEPYAHVVRGLCKLEAARGQSMRKLAMEQFRYGFSGKSLVFACVAMLGKPGMKLWKAVGESSRGLRGHNAEGDAPFAIGPNP
jgi:hypothetical protein